MEIMKIFIHLVPSFFLSIVPSCFRAIVLSLIGLHAMKETFRRRLNNKYLRYENNYIYLYADVDYGFKKSRHITISYLINR